MVDFNEWPEGFADDSLTVSATSYQRLRLTVRHFETLSAIMHWRSITGAATSLSLTQSSVSKLLNSLEEELGIKLFVRQHRGCYPTPEAEALIPLAQRVLDSIESVQRAAWDLREGEKGSVSVVTNPTLGNFLLPSIVGEFWKRYKDSKVSLRVQPARLIPDLISTHQVDMGVVLFPSSSADIETTPLPSGQFVCVLPPRHHLASKSKIHVRELEGENVIKYSSSMNFGRLLDKLFLDEKVNCTTVCDSDSSAAIIGMVRGGIGVGSFKRIFGGRKMNGTAPEHFMTGSGSIARHILKELESLKIVEKVPNAKGRRITAQGQRDLDSIARQIGQK